MIIPPSITFSNENLHCLSPFHLLINSGLLIEACGHSMKKLHGHCVDGGFSEYFELIRPVEAEINFEVLCSLSEKLVLLKVRKDDSSGILIKGQFAYLENENKLFFTGTPWFNSIEALRTTNLMLSDFPHHSPTIDLLHLIKTQEIINQDLNRLVITINEQKNKLKAGEKQILAALQKERELSLLKSNFVTFASHEFRTPLACIRSSMELLEINLTRPGTPLNNTIKHHTNILTEVDHLNELVDEFLTVGKIESNTFTCKKEMVDLNLILQKVIQNLEQIQDDNRSITLNTDQSNREILADPLLSKHIFNNLFSNALKYSKGENQPVVTVEYEAESVFIKIRDFGIGIQADEQAKIFQAFFRAETVHQIQGTGLGLFITKNFIDLQGGKISFKSIQDQGTEFIVSLPTT